MQYNNLAYSINRYGVVNNNLICPKYSNWINYHNIYVFNHNDDLGKYLYKIFNVKIYVKYSYKSLSIL